MRLYEGDRDKDTNRCITTVVRSTFHSHAHSLLTAPINTQPQTETGTISTPLLKLHCAKRVDYFSTAIHDCCVWPASSFAQLLFVTVGLQFHEPPPPHPHPRCCVHIKGGKKQQRCNIAACGRERSITCVGDPLAMECCSLLSAAARPTAVLVIKEVQQHINISVIYIPPPPAPPRCCLLQHQT